MNKVITISSLGDVNVTTPDFKPSLKEMQAMVGGYIEPIRPMVKARIHEDNGMVYTGTMVVNEDGIRLDLPFNAKASLLTQRTIRGDVFILVGWRI